MILSKSKNGKAQGAIEYLLLLSAAIIVVAIVISFLPSIITPAQGSGSKATYDYLCKTIIAPGTNAADLTQDCKCYLRNVSTPGNPSGPTTDANSTICCAKSDALLRANWNCPTS